MILDYPESMILWKKKDISVDKNQKVQNQIIKRSNNWRRDGIYCKYNFNTCSLHTLFHENYFKLFVRKFGCNFKRKNFMITYTYM